MKNFYLNFTLNSDDTKLYNFIDSLLEYELLFTEETQIIGTIYVDCPGGSNKLAALLHDFMLERKDRYKFIVNGYFSSNTILVFGALNPELIEFKRQSYSCVHLSSYDAEVREVLFYDKNHHSHNYLKYFKAYNKDLLELFKEFLDKKEIKSIKTGGDVIINSTRLVNIFEKLKKNKNLQKKFKKIFEITL